jgi:transcription-repair coupling factor (superfamily II helicase)
MYNKDHNHAKLKKWIQEGARALRVTGPSGAARVYFLACLLMDIQRPCLVLLPRAKDANRFYRELEFFLPESYVRTESGERRLFDFPTYDISPLAGLSPHKDVITRRLQALYSLTSEKHPIVVTSIETISLRILPKESMIKALEYMEIGEDVEREKLLQRLEADGYLRTSLVEERGDYSVRGGVIDIFPPLYSYPVRLEFWGDRLESIRHFDPLSQRSTKHLKEFVLLPGIQPKPYRERQGQNRTRLW